MNDRPTDPTAYAIAIAAGLAAEWRRQAQEYRQAAAGLRDATRALCLYARAERADADADALMALDLGPPDPPAAVCDGCGASGPTDLGKIAMHRAQNGRVCPGSGLPPREPVTEGNHR